MPDQSSPPDRTDNPDRRTEEADSTTEKRSLGPSADNPERLQVPGQRIAPSGALDGYSGLGAAAACLQNDLHFGEAIRQSIRDDVREALWHADDDAIGPEPNLVRWVTNAVTAGAHQALRMIENSAGPARVWYRQHDEGACTDADSTEAASTVSPFVHDTRSACLDEEAYLNLPMARYTTAPTGDATTGDEHFLLVVCPFCGRLYVFRHEYLGIYDSDAEQFRSDVGVESTPSDSGGRRRYDGAGNFCRVVQSAADHTDETGDSSSAPGFHLQEVFGLTTLETPDGEVLRRF